jgi:hypothetical protein
VVRRVDDLKSALFLSAAFAAAAAAAVPPLLPLLPEEARSLPLPLPAFCAVLACNWRWCTGCSASRGSDWRAPGGSSRRPT